MEEEAIRQMQAIETEHWWFVGRRSILSYVIHDLRLPHSARILEAGCGAGGNHEMLAALGEVSAFEPHPFCLDHARSRGIEMSVRGSCLTTFPSSGRPLISLPHST